jgi:hypothetical protein
MSDDKTHANDKLIHILEHAPQMVPHLVQLMHHPSHTVRSPVLHVLGNVASGDAMHTQCLLDAGALPGLAVLLRDPKEVIRKEAAWCIRYVFHLLAFVCACTCVPFCAVFGRARAIMLTVLSLLCFLRHVRAGFKATSLRAPPRRSKRCSTRALFPR